MNVMEVLMSKRWIVRSEEKDLYYRVKDQIGTVKKFLAEKLGYQIIVNQSLVKLEKMPAVAEEWMGITEFTDVMEYIFLCMILMYLEDKEAGEQFVLSDLTEYIQSNYTKETIDWTSYTCRRRLIRVMKYCVRYSMLRVNDGSEENFASSRGGEVLYENTGISRYFMKNFTKNIMDVTAVEGFEDSEWIDVNEERGIVRRQRVYRKLFMSVGMYKEGEADEDFAYVKNYRNMMSAELQEYIECELQVHKSSAFLILGENCSMGKCFPEENTLSDIVLLCNSLFLEAIGEGSVKPGADEDLTLAYDTFRSLIERCKERYGCGFIKLYRDMTTGEFVSKVRDYMQMMGFIEVLTRENLVRLRPVIGKISGRYPKDYKVVENNE